MKGLGILLEALAKLRAEHPHAHLVVIGRLKDDSAVPHLISDLGLDGAVTFVSGVSDQRIVELYAEAEIAVVVSDVPQGTTPEHAVSLIRLVMILNDVSLRNLIPGEIGKGFGFVQSKGQTAFSPVAVTPDELGGAFDGKKVHLPLLSHVNGKPFGCPNAGVDMTFDFPTLVSHAVKTRPLKAGSIIGSGTISNRDADGGPGKPIDQGGVGYSCIAEIRTVETILHGAPKTPYLNFGDRIRIEMTDAGGKSIFGAIEQQVVKA